jgi:hypothetical protein
MGIEFGHYWPVKRYPYRTATVTDRIMIISYSSNDDISLFQKELALAMELSGPDNHECYHCKFNDRDIYFMFSDWKMYVGLSLVVKDW